MVLPPGDRGPARPLRHPRALPPPRERRSWLHGVREAFDYRNGVELSGWAIALSYITAFPSTFMAMWADVFAGTASVLDLDEPPSRRRLLHRIRPFFREWWVAILAALLAEPVMYLLTYLLHSYGMIWPWEYWFPLE